MIQFYVALSVLVYSSVDLNAKHVVQVVVELDFPELLSQCISPPVSENNAVGEAQQTVDVISADNPSVFWVVVHE